MGLNRQAIDKTVKREICDRYQARRLRGTALYGSKYYYEQPGLWEFLVKHWFIILLIACAIGFIHGMLASRLAKRKGYEFETEPFWMGFLFGIVGIMIVGFWPNYFDLPDNNPAFKKQKIDVSLSPEDREALARLMNNANNPFQDGNRTSDMGHVQAPSAPTAAKPDKPKDEQCVCGKCGISNPKYALFCGGCGARLPSMRKHVSVSSSIQMPAPVATIKPAEPVNPAGHSGYVKPAAPAATTEPAVPVDPGEHSTPVNPVDPVESDDKDGGDPKDTGKSEARESEAQTEEFDLFLENVQTINNQEVKNYE